MVEPKAKTIIERHGFKDPELKTKTHDDLVGWTEDNASRLARKLFPDKENLTLLVSRWEQPIMDRSFTIGFIDLFTLFRMRGVRRGGDDGLLAVMWEIKTSMPSMGEMMRQIQMYQSHFNTTYLGQLIRRDRRSTSWVPSEVHRKSLIPRGVEWVVVSPEIEYSKRLHSQGISTVIYSPGV